MGGGGQTEGSLYDEIFQNAEEQPTCCVENNSPQMYTTGTTVRRVFLSAGEKFY